MPKYQMTTDGKGVESAQTLPVLNPATEEVIAQVPNASRTDVDAAVESAERAFQVWKATTRESRNRCIGAMLEAIKDNADALAELLTQEQGKPKQAALDEINLCLQWCEVFMGTELPDKVLEDNDASRVELQHKPLGVVAGIVPWNFPLVFAVWKLVPAALTGNTVILKPSPYTPLTTLKLGELIARAFPAGVVNILSGGDELGRWLVEHPGIQKVSFTGSNGTGKKIMASASADLKRLTLELGGNDAGIVLNDVDIAQVVEKIFWAAFYNSGQVCVALKRLYVHEDIYEALGAALAAYAQHIPMGNGLDEGVVLGPVQNKMQFDKVCELSESARKEGGRFLCGGEVSVDKGYFFPVTIVADLDDDARLVKEEPFGPILPILKFSDIDDVVARANNSTSGLGGSVWARDLKRGVEIAGRLECGTAWVNNHGAIRPDVPFGGAKESGYGVENTELGLAEFTQLQVVNITKA